MSADRDIVAGTAALLASSGNGFTYRSDGSSYQSGETAIVLGIMPETPDRCIVLNWLPSADNLEAATGEGVMQVAMRGVPNNALDILDLASAVKSVLHGLQGAALGSCTLKQSYRQQSVSMGQDDSLRLERADHYLFMVDYPPSPNTP